MDIDISTQITLLVHKKYNTIMLPSYLFRVWLHIKRVKSLLWPERWIDERIVVHSEKVRVDMNVTW